MKTISYQGVAGAYSEQACKNAYPNFTPVACDTFAKAMQKVENAEADIAMIPLENSTAGRVEEIYRLIPKMKLNIIAEHYEPVVHCLLGVKGSSIDDLTCVGSHPQALAQCHNNILSLNLEAIAKLDTAGSAKDLCSFGDKTKGAIASKLAADIYDLIVLKEHFEDISGNITRFFVLSRENVVPDFDENEEFITSLIFKVRDIPAALYKALGGFATNSINLLKIESYMHSLDDDSSFHIDIDGHIEQKAMKLALEELTFYAKDLKILGTYKKSS